MEITESGRLSETKWKNTQKSSRGGSPRVSPCADWDTMHTEPCFLCASVASCATVVICADVTGCWILSEGTAERIQFRKPLTVCLDAYSVNHLLWLYLKLRIECFSTLSLPVRHVLPAAGSLRISTVFLSIQVGLLSHYVCELLSHVCSASQLCTVSRGDSQKGL